MWECSSRCEQLHIFHLETGPQQDLVVTVWVWRNVVLLYVNCVYGFTGIGFWKDQNLSMTCLWWLKRDGPNINIESSQKWNDVLTYKTKKQSCLSLFPAQMFFIIFTLSHNFCQSCDFMSRPSHLQVNRGSDNNHPKVQLSISYHSSKQKTMEKSPSVLGTLMDSAICPLHLCKMWLHKQAIWYSKYHTWLVI